MTSMAYFLANGSLLFYPFLNFFFFLWRETGWNVLTEQCLLKHLDKDLAQFCLMNRSRFRLLIDVSGSDKRLLNTEPLDQQVPSSARLLAC